MKKIEGKNMVLMMFLKKSRLIYLFYFLLGCNTTSNTNQLNKYHLTGPLKYFKQVNESNFTVSTSYMINNIGQVELSNNDDFSIISITSNDVGSVIEISKKTNKLLQGLNILLKDSKNNSRIIRVNFYSRIINIHQLKSKQKIIFDRTIEVVPPLFLMSSLQTGEFIVCEKDNIIKHFELLKDLYFFSIGADSGYYDISEGKCQNPYFSLIIK